MDQKHPQIRITASQIAAASPGVILLASKKGFYKLGSDQTRLMSEPADYAGPIVRSPRRLDANNALRDTAEKVRDLAALEPFLQNGTPSFVGSVHLEDVLGRIKNFLLYR